jgi:hypothetical protein
LAWAAQQRTNNTIDMDIADGKLGGFRKNLKASGA